MRKIFPFIILYLIVNGVFLTWKSPLENAGYSVNFILIANTLLFLLTWLIFSLLGKNVTASNVHRFMRGVYSSFLIKMFVIVGSLLIFIVATRSEVNTPGILVSMGLYILYSAIEVMQLMKMVRNHKNE